MSQLKSTYNQHDNTIIIELPNEIKKESIEVFVELKEIKRKKLNFPVSNLDLKVENNKTYSREEIYSDEQ